MNSLSRLDAFISSKFAPRLSSQLQQQRPQTARGRRRRRQTYTSVTVPPPTTPIVLRIALVLWSILLSIWRSFVGETRATRGRVRRRRARNNGSSGMGGSSPLSGLGGLRELSERMMATATGITSGEEGERMSEGEGSEEEPQSRHDEREPWVDPVTFAPKEQESMEDNPPDEAEFVATSSLDSNDGSDQDLKEEKTMQGSEERNPDRTFAFWLRSANPEVSLESNRDEDTIAASARRRSIPKFQKTPPTSILENPLTSAQGSASAPIPIQNGKPQPASPAPRHRSGSRLLANPISTSLLDPSVPAPSSNAESSLFRPSPSPNPRRSATTPFHLQKTLILDLDETLIHSTSRPLNYPGRNSGDGGILGLSLGSLMGVGRKGKGREGGHTVEVVVNGRSTMYHVYKRPYVDHFLKKVASWYTLVIFTASMPEYADPVIDWLDNGRNLFSKKLYRESCHLQANGSYIKDLELVEKDLGKVCFMDNSPISYSWNKANALPIEGWTSDPNDEALLHSIPVLDSLRFVNDVRSVLGIRGFT
ncbi:hypothetical protein L204_100190 [Cryptococcus depauperatus]|nr:nuclear envelope-endoplasmic reticulum network protein [Cryptococcus depauperatus CBS 7855]